MSMATTYMIDLDKMEAVARALEAAVASVRTVGSVLADALEPDVPVGFLSDLELFRAGAVTLPDEEQRPEVEGEGQPAVVVMEREANEVPPDGGDIPGSYEQV